MPTIAVVGTEGSGKTVLLTTLAKRFGDGSEGIIISPQNRATNKFVEEVWTTLNSKEWPPTTPPGDLIQLHWKVEVGKGQVGHMSVNDCAGQDLRYLFAEEGVKDPTLAPKIRALVESVQKADVVLFVVNLRDFVAENDQERLTDNQWFLQHAMEFIKRSGSHKQFCLVFTQADQYPTYLKQHGSWKEVARSRLPQVFGAYLKQGRVEVIGVSAVRETVIVDDPVAGARRVPRPQFTSEGIDALGQWITDRMRQGQERVAMKPALRAGAIALPASFILTFLYLWIAHPVTEIRESVVTIAVPRTQEFPVMKKVTKYYILGQEMSWGVPYEVEVFSHYETRQVGEDYRTEKVPANVRVGIGAVGWLILLLVTAMSTVIAFLATFQYHLHKLSNETP